MALTRYKVIADIAEAMSASEDYEGLLESVAEQTAGAFDVSGCCVYEVSADARSATPVVDWPSPPVGHDKTAWLGTPIGLEDDPALARAVDGPAMVESLSNDPLLGTADRHRLQRREALASLLVPLAFGGSVIGCLELVEKRFTRPFTEYDREFAATVAALAAMAIHSARSRRTEISQRRHLQALLTASREVSLSTDYEDVLATIARTTAEVLEADACYIHLFDQARDAIVWQATWERYEWLADPEDGIGTVYPLSEFPYDREVMLTGKPIVQQRTDDELPDELRGRVDEWTLETFLTVPAMHEGQPIGILEIGQAQAERRFTAAEIALAQALAEQAAIMLMSRSPQRRRGSD